MTNIIAPESLRLLNNFLKMTDSCAQLGMIFENLSAYQSWYGKPYRYRKQN